MFSQPIETLLSVKKTFHSLLHLPNADRQKKLEQEVAALFALGLHAITGRIHHIRSITESDAPDIHLIEQGEAGIKHTLVEVVHYTPYSRHENLAAFLKRTKLTKKMYEPQTVIVCHVKDVYDIFDWQAIHKDLLEATRQYEVWVLLRKELSSLTYVLLQLLPELGVKTEFEVVKQGHSLKKVS